MFSRPGSWLPCSRRNQEPKADAAAPGLEPVPGATSSLSSYSVGHEGWALIWRRRTTGGGQWGYVSCPLTGSLTGAPATPRWGSKGLPLSSCPPPPWSPQHPRRSRCRAEARRPEQEMFKASSASAVQVQQSLHFRAKYLLASPPGSQVHRGALITCHPGGPGAWEGPREDW